VAGRALSEEPCRRAMVQVEAGGPRRPSSTSSGRARVTEDHRNGPEVAKDLIKESIELQPSCPQGRFEGNIEFVLFVD